MSGVPYLRSGRGYHPIQIRVGAYEPRILNVTGRVADGWLPSLGYLPDGPASLTALNQRIVGGVAERGD